MSDFLCCDDPYCENRIGLIEDEHRRNFLEHRKRVQDIIFVPEKPLDPPDEDEDEWPEL